MQTASQTSNSSAALLDYNRDASDKGDSKYQEYQQDFAYISAGNVKINLGDILQPLLGKRKAFVYKLDFKQDFYQTILRHEDKIYAQLYYFDYYQRVAPHLIQESSV